MQLVELTDADRVALDAAVRTTPRVREWRRLQAVRLLAEGREAPEVAQVLGCSASSVYYWADDWRKAGLAGLAEGPHAGRPRRLDLDAEAALEQMLASDPQAHSIAATDWTAPLLRTTLRQRGHELSERTLRRTLHRLGWRWKRPKYVLGRPDPAYEAKKGRWSSKLPRH
jgi:transposase